MVESKRFDDAEEAGISGTVTSITIHHGSRIDAIKCKMSNGRETMQHGPTGGERSEFFLQNGEEINVVFIWWSDVVNAIRFGTTNGRLSPKYGGGGGEFATYSPSLERPRSLGGFWGDAGDRLDSLVPNWVDSTLKQSRTLIVGTRYGGGGGNFEFTMLNDLRVPLSCKLWSITTWSGKSMDSIECRLSDFASDNILSIAGGSGRPDQTIFKLEAGDYIGNIEVWESDSVIKALRFRSAQGLVSPVMGHETGTKHEWSAPTWQQGKYGLLCFGGKSERLVDSLYPIWAPMK